MKWANITIIIIIGLVIMANIKKQSTFQEFEAIKDSFIDGGAFTNFITSANGWISEIGLYTFGYPSDKSSGYYVIEKRDCPPEHCDECWGEGSCSGTIPLYTIKDGYIEDFTYQSDYPIYGAWDIRQFNDFRDKCFIGDCNKANKRNVICIYDNLSINVEQYLCDKWESPYSGGYTALCTNGQKLMVGDSVYMGSECSKPKIINFYYVYNDYPNYEGYSSSWKSRWRGEFNLLNAKLQEYGINMTANYYEYKLDDDSEIPSTFFHSIKEGDEPFQAGDIQVTIFAGINNPSNYGYTCPGNTSYNPCQASASTTRIRIPDYYYYTSKPLIHEFGHAIGCPHTGQSGSMAAHLYMGDIMSYGDRFDFWYECRIALWMLGQNE